MNEINTLLDYIKWRGDLSFKDSAFNDIDAMVLAQLTSIDYGDIIPGSLHVDDLSKSVYSDCPTISQISKRFKEMISGTDLEGRLDEAHWLLFAAGNSNRFGSIRADGYINDIDSEKVKQFSALTFYLKKRLVYIAFRGTDDTFISWKENFHMSYMFPIPSQADAAKYLEIMAQGFMLRCLVGGHSKGGNLAVYASSFCNPKIQKRIKKVYAFDAPGFMKDLNSDSGYSAIRSRINGYMPKSSIIGTIMTVPYTPLIVDSQAVSVTQHHMYTWDICGNSVVLVDNRDKFSHDFEDLLNEKLNCIAIEDKPQYIDEFFNIFSKNNIYKISDFSSMDFKQIFGLIKGATSISPVNRDLFLSIFKLLWDEQRKK